MYFFPQNCSVQFPVSAIVILVEHPFKFDFHLLSCITTPTLQLSFQELNEYLTFFLGPFQTNTFTIHLCWAIPCVCSYRSARGHIRLCICSHYSPKDRGLNTLLMSFYSSLLSGELRLFISQYLEDIEKYGGREESNSILVQAFLGFFFIKLLIQFLEML